MFLLVRCIVSMIERSIAVAFAPLVLREPLLIFRMMTSFLNSRSLMLFVGSTSGSVTNLNKLSTSLW